MILNNIPFHADLPAVQQKLRIKDGSTPAKLLASLAIQAEAISRPKALYRLCFVEAPDGQEGITIDGVPFTSRLLRRNLAQAHGVFPYVATCGQELNRWMHTMDDLLANYLADALCENALRQASDFLLQHLQAEHQVQNLASMNPGSLPDWPITAQKTLFHLLGDTEEAVGVTLTDSMLMIPAKSVSGIYFSTKERFVNCELCPREGCPSRRAPYDVQKAGMF
jgi:hypothetical protein